MNRTREYDSFRAALGSRMAKQGATPAQIRAALADIDARARERREAAEKRQQEGKAP